MKFFTASFFQPENHHGEIVSISRSNPPQFQNVIRCVSLAPSQDLLDYWKNGISEQEYTEHYRKQVGFNWDDIMFWLRVKAGQEDDLTLCSDELAGEFGHRNLVAKIIERHFPENYGGCDVPNSCTFLNLR